MEVPTNIPANDKHRFWFKIFIDQLNKVHDNINKSKQYGWKD